MILSLCKFYHRELCLHKKDFNCSKKIPQPLKFIEFSKIITLYMYLAPLWYFWCFYRLLANVRLAETKIWIDEEKDICEQIDFRAVVTASRKVLFNRKRIQELRGFTIHTLKDFNLPGIRLIGSNEIRHT